MIVIFFVYGFMFVVSWGVLLFECLELNKFPLSLKSFSFKKSET